MSGQRRDTGDEIDYISYLLRLWRVTVGGKVAWRASLEDPYTGERLGFAGFPDLLSYLEEQTGQAPDPDQEEGGERPQPRSESKTLV